ncbi:uncharacterized protein DUF4440 [Jatrophihabitans sp. GAS493]|uniref:nuclear transport factor 2 family protein n=1 Tax=Jatrophihabitans sp. GAS493 TaxID=1907575 RepID=UPI000BB968EB|nr:nuclear transport factor 2 family protein [Jatrophihabitans sp. GAS493]SOD70881.1 uncharacterized protein DUF4440 [Jatrophihabitans sp. GAS493]
MSARDIVGAALAAYRAQDLERMQSLLADGFRFTSPQDDHIDRTAFLERCFPTAARFVSQEILQLTDVGPAAAMVLYEYQLADGTRYRNVEYSQVRDGKLVETEVFFGGRV